MPTLRMKDHSQTIQGRGNIGVVRTQSPFADDERAPVNRLGIAVATQPVVENSELFEQWRHAEMIGSGLQFGERDGAPGDRDRLGIPARFMEFTDFGVESLDG